MSKLIIVSNRLPVTAETDKDSVIFKPSIGGLATGMKNLHTGSETVWVGWSGLTEEELESHNHEAIVQTLREEHGCIPVTLSENDLNLYYYGFCNKTIWPLFHYFMNKTVYDSATWEHYKTINTRFYETIERIIEPNDTVWIQDYQLMLLPKLLREKQPFCQIGFFLHIPFPSYEIFRLLPWREKILEGLLGADLIGFHSYDYVRHFNSSVRRILGYEHNLGYINFNNRMVRADVFPMGIDYEKFLNASKEINVRDEIRNIGKSIGNTRAILSVDRLDYTKGIPQRLNAFELFLKKYPEYREKVSLLQVIAPSRTGVDEYQDLKSEIDELISKINGEHGTISWRPIIYLYQSFPFASIGAMYCVSDIMLVTPLRDGMNLVAKEFIAAHADKKGVLILSETAGAASELGEAIIVNPNNIEQIADAIKEALETPVTQQTENNMLLHERLKSYNVEYWAHDFISKLDIVKEYQQRHRVRILNDQARSELINTYSQSRKRLLLLNYDGTLIQFAANPAHAKADQKLKHLLTALGSVKNNEVVIISGHNREDLDAWLGDLPIHLIADHGVWLKEKGGIWENPEKLDNEWKETIRPVIHVHRDRTPGSRVEEKDFSIAWHYRRCDPDLAFVRVSELKEALINLTDNLELGLLEGDKVIEVKHTSINKGRAARLWLDAGDWDFVLCIGDDKTDEDIFAVLPDSSYSVKVGFDLSKADYNLESPHDVRKLIEELIKLN